MTLNVNARETVRCKKVPFGRGTWTRERHAGPLRDNRRRRLFGSLFNTATKAPQFITSGATATDPVL